MRINPISSNAFRAKLTRNTQYAENANGEVYNKSTTKKDMVNSYNSQITAIRKQRDAAIELDNYMRSEPVKRCLDKLPKNDEIEIINNFSSMRINEDGETEFDPMFLMYKFEDPKSVKMLEYTKRYGKNKNMEDELSICYVQNKDGSINKRGIAEYLIEIAKFLGVK